MRFSARHAVCLLLVVAGICPRPSLAGDPAPRVRVEHVRRAFHNGEHNAFTDLTRWRGQFWLTFRSCPDGHGVSATASVVVLASPDAREWRQVHRYREWTRQDLPGLLGGPMLARWGNQLVTGGRGTTPQGPRTGVLWLAGDQLLAFAELPSGGDNSYPGFVELDDGRGLVSWYSTHEKDAEGKPITAIYLAELARND